MSFRPKWLSLPALVALIVLAAAGCTAATATPTTAPAAATSTPTRAATTPTAAPTATTAPTPTVGVISKPIIIVWGKEPPALGILNHSGTEAPHADSNGDLLVMANANTGVLEPMLALSWSQEAPDRWRFKLRQGVKFHDGEPFNATTASYSVETMTKTSSNSRIVRYAPNLKGIAVDEYTLDIQCQAGCPTLISVMPQLKFAPPAWDAANPTDRTRIPMGTGPYKFAEWKAGEFMRHTVFPEYWGAKPSIPEIKFVWRGETSVRTAMLMTGEAHMGNVGMLDEKTVPKFISAASPDTVFIRLRARQDPQWEGAKGIALRQALAYSLDCNAIVKTLMAGKAECRPFAVHESSVGYPKSITPYTYNVEKAKALLKEAGAEGLEFDLIGTVGTDEIQTMEAVAGYWTAIGLKPKPKLMEGELRTKALQVGPGNLPVHAMFIGHTNDIYDLTLTVPYLLGCSQLNAAFRCDQVLEDKYKVANAAVGAERQRLFEELGVLFHNEVAAISLWTRPQTYGLVKELEWKPRFDLKVRVDTMHFTK